ncbi:DNA replication and repair protein RecF [Flavonifractor plautii]|nr:DNA replication and repair protein RecF [Flavonifractor plautii]
MGGLHPGGPSGPGVRRQLYSNGVRLKSAGELSGVLNTVLFCPEDLYLIREGAATRRRFLDGCICQLRPKYAEALAEYRRLYEHKVRILRDWEEHPSLLDTLDEFNLRMAQTGALLIHYRAHFVKRLREVTPPSIWTFPAGGRSLAWPMRRYPPSPTRRTAPKHPPQLLAHQESHRKAELESRQCLSGPHKDDLTVELNGMSAKTFASQGQTRTAALSLKLASREIFYQETGEWPVLLLDDVLSELDARRQEFVLRRINGGQVFITCCEDARLEGLEEGRSSTFTAGR